MKLIYLTHTPPDISYTVNALRQCMKRPKKSHQQAAHRVLRYLKSMVGLRVAYKRQGKQSLEIYSDVNFTLSLSDCRSTTGYFSFLACNLVTWRSKKQVVLQSGTNAEYRAMVHGISKSLWIRGLLAELKVEVGAPISLCATKNQLLM